MKEGRGKCKCSVNEQRDRHAAIRGRIESTRRLGVLKKPKLRNGTANRVNQTVLSVNQIGLKIRLIEPENR